MLAKIIDMHPGVAILMENVFQNRRRHWKKAEFWSSPQTLKEQAFKVFSKLKEPVVGNKVCTPDVWSADDILLFCHLFQDFKIVFIVRDPVQVTMSRFQREDYEKEFNELARQNILLDFRSRLLTYTSSWRQSIENYWRLRDGLNEKIHLIYYEDFCTDFKNQVRNLFAFLELGFSEEILNWDKYPHHDRNGNLVKDLKYRDKPIGLRLHSRIDLPLEVKDELDFAIRSIQVFYDLWKKRRI
jgi:hypothetical protein